MNVAWPDPLGIFPAFFATLKLSRHMQIAGACRAIEVRVLISSACALSHVLAYHNEHTVLVHTHTSSRVWALDLFVLALLI